MRHKGAREGKTKRGNARLGRDRRGPMERQRERDRMEKMEGEEK